MAMATVPVSHIPMQKIAQDRAVRICKLFPPDEAFGREMKSPRQSLFDFRPEPFYRPIAFGKYIRDFDTNPRPIVSFEKRFKERFADFLPNLGNGFNGSDAHVIIVIG